MKRTFLFSMLIICISCFSCEKDETKSKIKDYKKSLVGDYDWEESTTGKYYPYSTIITHSPSNTGNNYGFRIKKNYEVILYKNGEQIKKGKLKKVIEEDVWEHSPDGDIVTGSYYYKTIFSFDDETMTISDLDGFSCKSWPYKNCPNLFTKIK